MAKVKKCYRCGKIVKSYSYGDYCSHCADEVWDSGFESTTQHAEDIYEQEIEDRNEINKLLNKKSINYDLIVELMEYKRGKLRCSKCKKLRINTKSLEKYKNEGTFKLMLKRTCNSCGVEGFYIYENN